MHIIVIKQISANVNSCEFYLRIFFTEFQSTEAKAAFLLLEILPKNFLQHCATTLSELPALVKIFKQNPAQRVLCWVKKFSTLDVRNHVLKAAF
jgi:hypothetical protein